MAIVVGKTLTTRVIIRLTYLFTFTPSIEVITSCPARVPTVDEAMPDERRVTPKIIAASGPKRGFIISYA